MKIGKIPADILERIILNPISQMDCKRSEIVIRPKTGEDCSAIDLGGEICVVSTDPITGASKDAGYIAVHINCNDAAASGAEPVGILISILLPPESSESELQEQIDGARRACQEVGIEILGGHTEITDAVTRPVISGTVIAKTKGRKFLSSGGALLGQGVVMTKWAGLEGTAVIAKEYYKKLEGLLCAELLKSAVEFSGFLSVVKEGRIGAEFGATAMHDATEGGVLGAVWEVADCSGTGIEIDIDKIPVRKETNEICKYAGIDPYRLISSGTMIITAFDAEKLVERLNIEGIDACVIGRITNGEKQILKNGVFIKLEPPESDELYHVSL